MSFIENNTVANVRLAHMVMPRRTNPELKRTKSEQTYRESSTTRQLEGSTFSLLAASKNLQQENYKVRVSEGQKLQY